MLWRALTGSLLLLAPLAFPTASSATPAVHVVGAFYPVAYTAPTASAWCACPGHEPHARGGEPHDLELTPKQFDEILDADVVFDMGHRFQPAVEKAAQRRERTTITLLDHLPIHAGKKNVAEGDPSALDPHVWLDPVLMQDIVRQVQAAVDQSRPQGVAPSTRATPTPSCSNSERSTSATAASSPSARSTSS